MPSIIYLEKCFLKYIFFHFIGIIAVWLCLLIAISLAGSVSAIIISGSDEASFGRDVSNMNDALTDPSVGYGIPSSDIQTGENQSFADFQTAITQTNNSGASELHVYISTHGTKDYIIFSDGPVSKNDFISAINQSTAPTKHIILDACYSGSFYNDLMAIVGQDGSVITATDEDHVSRYFLSSWFTSKLTDLMQDPDTDTNGDGKVTYDEAIARLKKEGGWLANLGKPKSVSIPTLSEWKQIFLTLIMISLVMGVITNHYPKFINTNNNIIKINTFIMLTFNRPIFYAVYKWICIISIIGVAGNTIILSDINPLDIAGILFCAPLVAYILHIIVLSICEYKIINAHS